MRRALTKTTGSAQIPSMKEKSASQSRFFNLHVLIGVFCLLGGIFLALFATSAGERTHRGEANPSTGDGLSFDPATESAQTKGHPPNDVPFAPRGGVQEAWVARYNGPGNSFDAASAIAVDNSGNVHVTGQSTGAGPAQSVDYATAKSNTSGTEEWVVRYNSPDNSTDFATGIALDDSGTSLDYATIKYDTSGAEQWVGRYNGPGNLDDDARAIVVDGSGNAYVTGESFGSGN
jgi:uncharacterized iron-regulated membrane protein